MHTIAVCLAAITQQMGNRPFGKALRQFHNDIRRHLGNTFRDIGRILVEFLPQQRKRRMARQPANLIRTLECRGSRFVRRNASASGFVPHDNGINDRRFARLGIYGTFAWLHSQIAHSQVKTVVVFNEKWRTGVLQQKVPVMQTLRIENLP